MLTLTGSEVVRVIGRYHRIYEASREPDPLHRRLPRPRELPALGVVDRAGLVLLVGLVMTQIIPS
jgi:hypothetical protein